ncbi:GNAT family N-acetyltransferase [Flavobacterium sp. 7A]|uniref:GNAT family N-acetyltransferase n=1 Tax=Flavobacterium sp. 7A TaxID=2940571 RepID=UPI002225DDB6|nr:GNAT family N-acetyltransferase [Flavobacterium sp. 7A]MCW2118838.1 ribosomal protein S18 acetylase RimI-like enzyme [Flavobacterium sp. 7A]
MITIEVAGKKDLNLIQKIAYQVWPVAYGEILSKEQMVYMLESFYSIATLSDNYDKGCHFILAKEGDAVLGFAGFEHFDVLERTKIHKIYLLPESQGKGVGKLLVDYIGTRAIEKQFETLLLHVNRFNKALGFYEKLGFKIIEEVDIEIGNGYLMEDYVMERLLSVK